MEDKKGLAVLVTEMAMIETAIIEAGGELSPELETMLDKVGSQLIKKVDAYAFILDRLDLLDADYKTKADRFSQVSKSCKRLKERLTNAIKYSMQLGNLSEVKGEDMRFKLSDSRPSLVIDETLLPQAFKMRVETWVPDKEHIKAKLEAGETIPGASLESGKSLRKYVNKKELK